MALTGVVAVVEVVLAVDVVEAGDLVTEVAVVVDSEEAEVVETEEVEAETGEWAGKTEDQSHTSSVMDFILL